MEDIPPKIRGLHEAAEFIQTNIKSTEDLEKLYDGRVLRPLAAVLQTHRLRERFCDGLKFWCSGSTEMEIAQRMPSSVSLTSPTEIENARCITRMNTNAYDHNGVTSASRHNDSPEEPNLLITQPSPQDYVQPDNDYYRVRDSKELSNRDEVRIKGSDLQSLLEIFDEYKTENDWQIWAATIVDIYQYACELRRAPHNVHTVSYCSSARTDEVFLSSQPHSNCSPDVPHIWQAMNECEKLQIRSRYYHLALLHRLERVEKETEETFEGSKPGVTHESRCIDKLIEELEKGDKTKSAISPKQIKSRMNSRIQRGKRWQTLWRQYGVGILEVPDDILNSGLALKEKGWKIYLEIISRCCPGLKTYCMSLTSQAAGRAKQCGLSDFINAERFDQKVGIMQKDRTPLPESTKHYDELQRLGLLGKHPRPDNQAFECVSNLFEAMILLVGETQDVQVFPAAKFDDKMNQDLAEDSSFHIVKGKKIYVLPYWHLGRWHCAFASTELTLIPPEAENGQWTAIKKFFNWDDKGLVRSEQSLREYNPSDPRIFIEVWGHSLKYFLNMYRRQQQVTGHWETAIEKLDVCWWALYAACLPIREDDGSDDASIRPGGNPHKRVAPPLPESRHKRVKLPVRIYSTR